MKKALLHLSKVDPKLGAWIGKVGAYRIEISETKSAYAAFARSIVYQQLNGKAAATIWQRLMDLYPGDPELSPSKVVLTTVERLRSAGLSGAKTKALLDLSEKTLAKTLPDFPEIQVLGDEEILKAYTEVRGIGPWTVEMFLIFRLGRQDILPATDYGIRQGFKKVYGKRGLPEPKAILRYGEIWKPYRTVASWFLWRTLDVEME